jgi:hypothetical protein
MNSVRCRAVLLSSALNTEPRELELARVARFFFVFFATFATYLVQSRRLAPCLQRYTSAWLIEDSGRAKFPA